MLCLEGFMLLKNRFVEFIRGKFILVYRELSIELIKKFGFKVWDCNFFLVMSYNW